RPGAVVGELDSEIPIFAIGGDPGQFQDDGIRSAQLFPARDGYGLFAVRFFSEKHVRGALGVTVSEAIGGCGTATRVQVDGEIFEREARDGQDGYQGERDDLKQGVVSWPP